MKCPYVLAAVLLAVAGSAAAQDPDPPLPDLAVAEKDLGSEGKYWILHKPGVSFEQAQSDMAFCWRFLPHGRQRFAPEFVPWQAGDATRKITYNGGQYGLVGAVIGSIIDGPLERSIRQTRLFRCMVPRGYQRYRTSEAVWKRLNPDNPSAAIAIQARIAAGPTPPTPRTSP